MFSMLFVILALIIVVYGINNGYLIIKDSTFMMPYIKKVEIGI